MNRIRHEKKVVVGKQNLEQIFKNNTFKSVHV